MLDFGEKEKELAVEAYNSLKNRNKFLKLQVRSTSDSWLVFPWNLVCDTDCFGFPGG